MSDTSFLKWLAGTGWLVFSGGAAPGSPIRAQTLARASVDGGVAYISLADDGGDALLDDLEDLGAPTGYIVDIAVEDAETVVEQLREASVIVIEIGSSLDVLYNSFAGAAADGIRQAYERGAVVLIEGLAVNIFGRWVISDTGRLLDGLDWVVNAFIEPQSGGAEDSRAVQSVLASFPEAVAINIETGSALALGPGGQVELWGRGQVTLSLGSSYGDA